MSEIDKKNEWPSSDLEKSNSCPVCREKRRDIFFSDIEDKAFLCAPGKWTIYKCSNCCTGYLDPQPSPDSIHKAYAEYYTHKRTKSQRVLNRLRSSMSNGYRNYEFGTDHKPSSYVGVLISLLFPSMRASARGRMRHLPEAPKGALLLDFGCGDGKYLELISGTGWTGIGADFDPLAVKHARSKGLDVRHVSVKTDALNSYHGRLDAITISHVLEHVHDPVPFLVSMRKLLNENGWIWIETPNIEAQGLQRYQETWLGLDPPRHLTHFNRNSLELALKRAGYSIVEDQPYRPLCLHTFLASESIASGDGCIYKRSLLREIQFWFITRKYEKAARKDISKREFLTIRART